MRALQGPRAAPIPQCTKLYGSLHAQSAGANKLTNTHHSPNLVCFKFCASDFERVGATARSAEPQRALQVL